VDDDPGQRSLLESFLRSQRFVVVVADSGEQALALLPGGDFAMMISDVRMPGLSGLETLRLARQEHGSFPILLVTAYADVRDAVGAMRDGAVNYLSKPIDLDELLATVRLAAGRCDGVAPTAASHARRNHPARPDRSPAAVSLPGLGGGDVPTDDAGTDSAAHTARAGVPPPLPRDLPERARDLTTPQRDALRRWLRPGWPPGAKDLYAHLSDAVARASVRRWEEAMDAGGGTSEAMVWRLLRIGSAPYFVLGSSAARSLRLRIATSWDWRQQYQLLSVAMEPQPGGQPRVGWEAVVRDRVSSELHEVAGHMEVRWSHGRFGGLPEAKGYLDTPHHLVPGYYTLR